MLVLAFLKILKKGYRESHLYAAPSFMNAHPKGHHNLSLTMIAQSLRHACIYIAFSVRCFARAHGPVAPISAQGLLAQGVCKGFAVVAFPSFKLAEPITRAMTHTAVPVGDAPSVAP